MFVVSHNYNKILISRLYSTICFFDYLGPCSYLIRQKGQKRPFPVKISKKVTSKTPLIIGNYVGIVEFYTKIPKFLLNKVAPAAISAPSQYIAVLHKLQWAERLFF